MTGRVSRHGTRDAALSLIKKGATQEKVSGYPVLEKKVSFGVIGFCDFGTMKMVANRWLGEEGPKVLHVAWEGEDTRIGSFRRGAWERALLTLVTEE